MATQKRPNDLRFKDGMYYVVPSQTPLGTAFDSDAHILIGEGDDFGSFKSAHDSTLGYAGAGSWQAVYGVVYESTAGVKIG